MLVFEKKAIVFVVYENKTSILVSIRRMTIVFRLQEKTYSYKLRFKKDKRVGHYKREYLS